jgi:flagellar L-ring protein precursor FlgH
VCGIALLTGCVAPSAKPNDPYYAPVLPRTPLPAAANNGSIYQAGFEQNLYGDRKAYRVGDIITITLNEKMARPARRQFAISKTSKTSIGLTSLFGGSWRQHQQPGGRQWRPEPGRRLQRRPRDQGRRQGRAEQQPDRLDHRDRRRCVAQRHHLPVRGEKWMTLNTGDELVRIAGLCVPMTSPPTTPFRRLASPMRASPIPVQVRLPIPVSQAGSTDSSSARCSLSRG